MSHGSLPHGHPFIAVAPGQIKTREEIQAIADRLLDFHRSGPFSGFTMEETPEEKAAREKKEADDAAAKAAAGGGDDDPDITVEGRTFKTSELQRIMADEKRQGKRSGTTEALQKLGFDKLEDAEAFITTARERDKAAMTEAERKAAEAEEAKTAADKRQADADKLVRTTTMERALVRAGVNDADLDDAVTLLGTGLAADADADAIKAAADKLKERRAELFDGQSTGNGRPPAGGMPPGRPGGKPRPKGEPFGAEGLARAQKRWGDKAGKA